MNTGRVTLALMATASVCTAAACGDGSEGVPAPTPVPACEGAFTPCGGDIVGTWELTEACIFEPVSEISDDCPRATVTATEYSITMTASFASDGTLTRTESRSITAVTRMPTSCMVDSCAAMEEEIEANPFLEPGVQVTADCIQTSGICSCTSNLSRPSTTFAETYVVAGSDVTIAEEDGSVYLYSFCVTGETLVIRGADEMRTFRLTGP